MIEEILMENRPSVKISPIAFLKIFVFAVNAYSNETGGILIGKEVKDEIFVTDAEEVCETSSKAYVLLDPVKIANIAESLERKSSEEKIIGWWHSHPGYGADFLSEIDVNTQRIYQKLYDKAIALVIDPSRWVRDREVFTSDIKVYRLENERPAEILWEVSSEDVLKIIAYAAMEILGKRFVDGTGEEALQESIQKEFLAIREEIKTINILLVILSMTIILLSLMLLVLSP